jgi:ATP-binding cassette subfamily C protein LapB
MSNSAENVVPIPPGKVDYDPPVLTCLSILMGLMGEPRSVASLRNNLPQGDKAFTPLAALRAAHRAGAKAKVVARPRIEDISELVLPVILLLKSNNACVLTKIGKDSVEIIMPELGAGTMVMAIARIAQSYTGQAILLQPDPKLDKRAKFHERFSAKAWFWNTLWNFRPIYLHVVLASIMVNFLALASPLFTMNVYDRVIPANSMPTLWVMFTGVIIAFVFDFILKNMRSYFVDLAGRNADTIIASRIMQQLMGIRMDNLPPSTGGLVNNIREFEQLRDFFGSTTLLALVDIPFLIIFLIVIYMIAGPLVLAPIIAIPLVIAAGIFLQTPMRKAITQGEQENMQKNAILVETVSGLDTIKTNQAEGLMQRRWEDIVSMNAQSTAASKKLVNLTATITMSSTQIVTVICVAWGVHFITLGEMSTGALIATSILLGRVMAPLSSVANMLSRLQKSRYALEVLDHIMSLPSERPEDKDYLKMDFIESSLEFKNVHFGYAGAANPALQGVSFSIKAGEKVAIIGNVGSGKTTLGRLCMRLYLPGEEQITMGGIDIQQLDVADLRRKIGYVSQDNFLFFGSVRANITFGFPTADDQLILRAAYLSGVSDFVRKHEAGFGMPVGERGMALSGGQRQAVTIARALLPDPDILIMDEPTSSMDGASESAFFSRLQKNLEDKTMILITHRYSLLPLVDRILVMDQGKIVADGPRDQILRLTNKSKGAKNKNAESKIGSIDNFVITFWDGDPAAAANNTVPEAKSADGKTKKSADPAANKSSASVAA